MCEPDGERPGPEVAVILAWLLLAPSARAELPPPDYHTALANAAADEIRHRAESAAAASDPAKEMESAEAFAAAWRRAIGSESGQGQVVDDAKLAYELGLGWRLAGDQDRALAALDLAITEDPSMIAARYDRGEIELNRGQLDIATTEFQTVVRLAPDGWPGHFRLADLARRTHDVVTFERELTEALRCGFSFRELAMDPTWHATLADPTLGPVMRKLITVYQGDDVLQLFERTP